MTAATKNDDLDVMTLAMHFLLPTARRQVEEIQVVATRLVERVIRAMQPLLGCTGTVIVRAAPLLTDWVAHDCATEWWESIQHLPRFENGTLLLFGIDPSPSLERAFVVTVTGRLKGLINDIGRKLKHHRKNRLLFIAQIDPHNRIQELLYLSPAMIPIGELDPQGGFEASFDLIEYTPEMTDMLAHLLGEFTLSNSAWRQLEKLVARELGEPSTDGM